MRIAWIGPAGNNGGVPALGGLLLDSVLQLGEEVDLFIEDNPIPEELLERTNLTIFRASTWWRWGKWYSKHAMTAFLSGLVARTQVHKKICEMVLARHRSRPYDCIFQVSQAELFKLGRHIDELPPIVIFPCVHAAGELCWHRRESRYAIESEGRLLHYCVRLMLLYRAAVQRRQIQLPAMILGLSRRFNELLVQDYGVPPDRLNVLYHAIRDAGNDASDVADSNIPPKPMRLLFVARISVRKGFEQIVELSRRLDDLQGQITIEVIGDKTQWSDYTGHIKELNPRIAKYLGQLSHSKMARIYDGADILLVPSMYEPGGLVVGEALSHGVNVVASDEVGSAEPIAKECCHRFPAGNVDAFEAVTRVLISKLGKDRVKLRQVARMQARRYFAPEIVSRRLISCLQDAATRSTSSRGSERLELAAQ